MCRRTGRRTVGSSNEKHARLFGRFNRSSFHVIRSDRPCVVGRFHVHAGGDSCGPVGGGSAVGRPRGRRPTIGGQAMRALIVDGDRDLLDVMAYALRRAGHEIIAAGDGQEALDRHQADHPDIVLLELKLGRLSGFEVCRRIRLESDVPIIVVSASREEPDMLRALRLGADDYVTKPYSLRELAARMETVARRCRGGATERTDLTVKAGDLELHLQSYEATRGGGEPVQRWPERRSMPPTSTGTASPTATSRRATTAHP